MSDPVQFSAEVVDAAHRRFVITVDLVELKKIRKEAGTSGLLQTIDWISTHAEGDLKAALRKEFGLDSDEAVIPDMADRIVSEEQMSRTDRLVFAIALALDTIHKSNPGIEEVEDVGKACEVLRRGVYAERCFRLDPGQTLILNCPIASTPEKTSVPDKVADKKHFFPETSRFRYLGEFNENGYAKCALEGLPEHDSKYRKDIPYTPAPLGAEIWLLASQFEVEGENAHGAEPV